MEAARHNEHEVRLKIDGEERLVPIDKVDPSKVELNCDGERCYLVPDDGNPHNDIVPGDHEHVSSAGLKKTPPPITPSKAQENQLNSIPLHNNAIEQPSFSSHLDTHNQL